MMVYVVFLSAILMGFLSQSAVANDPNNIWNDISNDVSNDISNEVINGQGVQEAIKKLLKQSEVFKKEIKRLHELLASEISGVKAGCREDIKVSAKGMEDKLATLRHGITQDMEARKRAMEEHVKVVVKEGLAGVNDHVRSLSRDVTRREKVIDERITTVQENVTEEIFQKEEEMKKRVQVVEESCARDKTEIKHHVTTIERGLEKQIGESKKSMEGQLAIVHEECESGVKKTSSSLRRVEGSLEGCQQDIKKVKGSLGGCQQDIMEVKRRLDLLTATTTPRPTTARPTTLPTTTGRTTRIPTTVTTGPPGRSNTTSVGSCKWLKEKYNVPSGMYWITLQTPTQVYCDMEAGKGGWTMVGRSVVDKYTRPEDMSYKNLMSNNITQLDKVTTKHFLLSAYALNDLKTYINFTQIRFYCHKPSHNRTLHIRTLNNTLGRQVVNLMTEHSNETPRACHSYARFPDDDSLLGKDCSAWHEGRWNVHEADGGRLYNFPMWSSYTDNYFALIEGRAECDDWYDDFDYSNDGRWEFYVR